MEQAVGNGKREDRRAEEQEEEAAAAPAAAPVPAKAAAATKKAMVAAAGPVPEDLCHFPFTDIDPDCPRFISIDWRTFCSFECADRFAAHGTNHRHRHYVTYVKRQGGSTGRGSATVSSSPSWGSPTPSTPTVRTSFAIDRLNGPSMVVPP